MEIEQWKDVVGYDGRYQVSSFGRVKSLAGREKMLRPGIIHNGYLTVSLTTFGKEQRMKLVNRLVLEAFEGYSELDVDHINGIKTDNRLENLRYLTRRNNISEYHLKKGTKTSKYTGVSWYAKRNKWQSAIFYNGKSIWLGLFDDEVEASMAYQKFKTEKLTPCQ